MWNEYSYRISVLQILYAVSSSDRFHFLWGTCNLSYIFASFVPFRFDNGPLYNIPLSHRAAAATRLGVLRFHRRTSVKRSVKRQGASKTGIGRRLIACHSPRADIYWTDKVSGELYLLLWPRGQTNGHISIQGSVHVSEAYGCC